MNQPFQDYDLGDLVSWGTMLQLRDGVNAALEAARNEKKIGKSLEAHVTVVTREEKPPVDLSDLRQHFDPQWWADFFIVSGVDFVTDPALYDQASDTPLNGVRVLVSQARGEKCERCWKHHPWWERTRSIPPCAPGVQPWFPPCPLWKRHNSLYRQQNARRGCAGRFAS